MCEARARDVETGSEKGARVSEGDWWVYDGERVHGADGFTAGRVERGAYAGGSEGPVRRSTPSHRHS